jgi:hypothetical protein
MGFSNIRVFFFFFFDKGTTESLGIKNQIAKTSKAIHLFQFENHQTKSNLQ